VDDKTKEEEEILRDGKCRGETNEKEKKVFIPEYAWG
jgi:hypothetical protein